MKLRRIIYNIERRYYGEDETAWGSLAISGPVVLTRVYGELQMQPQVRCGFVKMPRYAVLKVPQESPNGPLALLAQSAKYYQ